MVKSITITTTAFLSVISSVLVAGQLIGSPEVWECDAPGTEGFFVSENEVRFEHAAAACASSGGILADITNQNFLFASDMILNCVGQNENAWIRSWDYNPTNPQVRDCLAIYVGFSGPGGGIDLECGDSRYALCMEPGRRHTNTGRVRNYGAFNATRTVTVTQTLVPQNAGIYNSPFTYSTSSIDPTTYSGSVPEVQTRQPFVYTVETVFGNGENIQDLNPVPSNTVVGGEFVASQPYLYTIQTVHDDSDSVEEVISKVQGQPLVYTIQTILPQSGNVEN